jgi:hypothetical protein
MNLPGFTAEASLCQTSERYHMVMTPALAADGREVLPQFCYSPVPGVFCCYTPWFGWNCRRLHVLE